MRYKKYAAQYIILKVAVRVGVWSIMLFSGKIDQFFHYGCFIIFCLFDVLVA